MKSKVAHLFTTDWNQFLSSKDDVEIDSIEIIQELWSGYGVIARVKFKNHKSVIVKNVVIPLDFQHPRGWNSSYSHQRKVKSYQVEKEFYKQYSLQCTQDCKVPHYLYSSKDENNSLLIMEDLATIGYTLKKEMLSIDETKVCLKWLANFHGLFLEVKPKGLWEVGTYWHLATRREEFDKMDESALKDTAINIDTILNECKHKTLVHGDAKVANFCFTKDMLKTAAVDFQYVGEGCGMKDVIYLLSSCLDNDELKKYDEELLEYYFEELRVTLHFNKKKVEFDKLKEEWLGLYSFAWTDFVRFLKGWMPNHYKIHDYSNEQVEIVLKNFNLLKNAPLSR